MDEDSPDSRRPAAGAVADAAPVLPAHESPRHRVAFATVLTALSGFVDAIGYVQLNHLFLSFMSGNSTHLGMTLAKAGWHDALAASTIIAAFVAGATAGTLIADMLARSMIRSVLGTELILCLVAIGLAHAGHGRIALGLLAIAMGMQNTLHQVAGGADLGKGFISGTLVSLGQSLARLPRDRREIVRGAQNLLSWSTFIAGATLGTLAFVALGPFAALIAVAAAITCVLALATAGWL